MGYRFSIFPPERFRGGFLDSMRGFEYLFIGVRSFPQINPYIEVLGDVFLASFIPAFHFLYNLNDI